MQVHTQCPWPCSRPPLTHSSTGDSWTITGKSGSVSCRITASFSWVLLHPRFCLCPPRVCFPVLYKFWQLYGGFNDDLFQESLCHTQVCCTQSPCPHGRPLLTHTFSGDTQTQFWLSLYGVSGVLWDWSSVFLGLWVVWALWAPLAGEGFDSQYDFAPAIILLGLYLCPWMWGIFFFFLVESNILHSTVVQQRVVLEFSQKMSAIPPTLPSYATKKLNANKEPFLLTPPRDTLGLVLKSRSLLYILLKLALVHLGTN